MFEAPDPSREAAMIAFTVMMVLCTASAAFYVRFLVALYKERRPRRFGHWVRLRIDDGEDAIVELPERKTPVTRAA
jgi:hypothetical protein